MKQRAASPIGVSSSIMAGLSGMIWCAASRALTPPLFPTPVMIRQGGGYLYTLPSVVDDIDFNISHVIRGEDHVANTAAQIQLFEALGAKPPRFGHHNLLIGADGKTLSKRKGSLSVLGLREAGLEPLAINSHAATIGSSHPVAPQQSMEDIAKLFDFAKLSRAPARFDETELRHVNAKLLHELPFSVVETRLAKKDIKGGEPFWLAIRGNLELFDEINPWAKIVFGEIDPVIEDQAFCQKACELLPKGPFDEQTWASWTKTVKEETGAKGRSLFMPLRKALTGKEHGPELNMLLPLMSYDKVSSRLLGKKA